MKVKLLALDIDGTVLDSQGQINDDVLNCLNEIRAQGIKVLLATGRRFISTVEIIKQLQIDQPIITHNGALIFDIAKKRKIYDQTLDNEYVKLLFDNVDEELDLYLDSDNDVLYYRDPKQFWGQQYIKNSQVKVEKIAISRLNNRCIHRLVITGDQENILTYLQRFNLKLKQMRHIMFRSPNYDTFFTEILHAQASKGAALAHLCQHYNISSTEVMAFGDDVNDLEMIKWAGFGVAMGNAVAELKQVADFVTSDNDQGGLIEVLQRISKGGEFDAS